VPFAGFSFQLDSTPEQVGIRLTTMTFAVPWKVIASRSPCVYLFSLGAGLLAGKSLIAVFVPVLIRLG
jgi:hypothetical protein